MNQILDLRTKVFEVSDDKNTSTVAEHGLPKTVKFFLTSFERGSLDPLEFRSTPSVLFSSKLIY